MADPDSKDSKDRASSEEREELARSEKAANREQPRNWKEDALEDKIVEVPPVSSETPMRGLDPERDREGKVPSSDDQK